MKITLKEFEAQKKEVLTPFFECKNYLCKHKGFCYLFCENIYCLNKDKKIMPNGNNYNLINNLIMIKIYVSQLAIKRII